jgi:hypothetical protein
MKGKLDKDGCLWLWRKNQLKRQDCRSVNVKFNLFNRSAKVLICRDICSLFGEPYKEKTLQQSMNGLCPSQYKETGKIALDICQKILVFDELIDERKHD